MNQIISRLLLSALMVLLAAAGAYANSSVGKRINAVKLGGKCFYAESTDPSEEVAKSDATTFLAAYINEYLKDNDVTKDKVTESTIPGVKYFTMDRSGNKRVFAFVEKAVILDGATPAPQPADEDAAPAPAPEAAAAPVPVSAPAPSKEEHSGADALADVFTSLAGAASFDDVIGTDTGAKSEPQAMVFSSLAQSENLKTAYLSLQRLNAEYVVKRFGPVSKCKNKMWSYMMIYSPDGKTLVGFLTPGKEGERIDMVGGTENASLDKFLGQGNAAIYFELR